MERAEIKASQEAPAEKLVEIAQTIWREVRASGVAADDDAGNDRLLSELRAKHPDFAMSFPIPFRWMVQAREFDAGAFEKYLRSHVKGFYKDRKEFLEAQAEYLVLLFKARHPRAGVRPLARYRAAVAKSLADDDEAFMEAREAAETEVGRLDAEADQDRRRRMHAYLSRLKGAPAASPRE